MRVEPSSIVACTGALMLIPATVAACSICMDSLAYSAMPWLPYAFLLLLYWFLADWALRLLIEKHPMPDGRGMPSLHTMIVFPVVAGFTALFMGTGALLLLCGAYLAFRLFREFCKPRWPLVGIGRLLSAAALGALMVITSIGIWQRSRMTTLEVYDQLVWSGTGQSRNMSRTLAKIPDFDIEQLRPMIAADNHGRNDKAFEVLRERKNPEDLVRFSREVMHHLPETKSAKGLWWDRIYLSMWFDSLGLKHIETRADLEEWLNQLDSETDDPSETTPRSDP